MVMESVIPRWGWFRYLNPVCSCGSAFQLINRAYKGPFQQERAHVHSHNGKCFRNLGFGNRDSCSAAVVLQHHAKCCRLYLPPIFESTPWLRYRGLDEVCVCRLSSMEALSDLTDYIGSAKRSSCILLRCSIPLCFPWSPCWMHSIRKGARESPTRIRRD